MVAAEYVREGLQGLARAHRVNQMSGHLGAAVVAGTFLGRQWPQADAAVYRGIERELDRIIAGESVFSPGTDAPLTVADMFAPFPEDEARPDLVASIAEALSRNIDRPRASGHNVIFAAIAIRAFREHPAYAIPSMVEGIRCLTAGFDDTGPGSGYYGKGKGRIDGRNVSLGGVDAVPPYTGVENMARVVLGELVRRAHEHVPGYGGLWHLINHAAALVELRRLGYADLARAGLPAHREHLLLLRTVPDAAAEMGPETPVEHDPRTPTFWAPRNLRRERAHLTHRIKTLYAFGLLAPLVDDDTSRQAATCLQFLL